jgi:hypothetical protein
MAYGPAALITTQATRSQKGSVSEAYNGLTYASSDQLARNLVQYTRLLAFSVKAQFFLSLRRQKPIRGRFVVAGGGVSEIEAPPHT